MRSCVRVLAVLAALQANSAAADELDWRVAAAATLPLAVSQLVLHEAAHGLVLQLAGYPVSYRYTPGRDPTGRLELAGFRYQGDPPRPVLTAAFLAPRLLDLAIIAGATLALRAHPPAWLASLLWAWRLVAQVDLVVNSVGIFGPPSTSDAWRSAELLGLPAGPARAATAVLLGGVAFVW